MKKYLAVNRITGEKQEVNDSPKGGYFTLDKRVWDFQEIDAQPIAVVRIFTHTFKAKKLQTVVEEREVWGLADLIDVTPSCNGNNLTKRIAY